MINIRRFGVYFYLSHQVLMMEKVPEILDTISNFTLLISRNALIAYGRRGSFKSHAD
jgi:hypothetical protein